ncbi:MAG: hypothetical protein R3264_08935 [Anaerolineae bacterium]|nr:hypothetical protein [Anaerolineae bacterium]
MTIRRDFLDGGGTLPILFHVYEDYEVWDGQVALILDQLLNHIKVLTDVAEGPIDRAVVKTLADHPHYQVGSGNILDEANRENVAAILVQECVTLLNCLVVIAPIMEIEQEERTHHFESTKAKVPFLNYQYPNPLVNRDRKDGDFSQ